MAPLFNQALHLRLHGPEGRHRLLGRLQSGKAFIRHLEGEIIGGCGTEKGGAAIWGQLPGQKPEQGGFPPAIAPHQPQLPVGVQLEVQPFKDGDVVPVVGKMQVLNGDLRHIVSSCPGREKAARGTFLSRQQGHDTPIGSRKGKTARFLLRTHDKSRAVLTALYPLLSRNQQVVLRIFPPPVSLFGPAYHDLHGLSTPL